jgi:hypothetical protein
MSDEIAPEIPHTAEEQRKHIWTLYIRLKDVETRLKKLEQQMKFEGKNP